MNEGLSASPSMILTVGHGARAIEALLAMLGAAGVERLVDVRTSPGSRRHPQFGRDALIRSLDDAGIRYEWRKDLGGFRTPRPDSPHHRLGVEAFRGYADHMDTEEFGRAVAWLVETSTGSPTAIMCAESDWRRCHRRMIADALTVRGCPVSHILAGGRLERHRLDAVARVDGTKLIYDGAGNLQARLPGD